MDDDVLENEGQMLNNQQQDEKEEQRNKNVGRKKDRVNNENRAVWLDPGPAFMFYLLSRLLRRTRKHQHTLYIIMS